VSKRKEKGTLLGITIIVVLAVMLILAFVTGFGRAPFGKSWSSIITAVYIQSWGILFLLSYFFSQKCFFFRGLMWICEHFSRPKGRWMAFFYFAIAFGIGTYALLIGLGILGS
jgi:hypothetical protein